MSRLTNFLNSVIERDPSVKTKLEVFFSCPGFHAVVMHRFAHWLWGFDLRIVARLVSNFNRFVTGIEIHPGAEIGEDLFIDHGSGVVIGGTAKIGNYVTLYQGATLGGSTPSVDSGAQRGKKRHPTLQDNVIVGSGAQILGPVTVHKNARVGSNAVVTKDVKMGSTVVGVPARDAGTAICLSGRNQFMPYGTPKDFKNLPEVLELEKRIASLESQLKSLQDKQTAQDTQKAQGEVDGKMHGKMHGKTGKVRSVS